MDELFTRIRKSGCGCHVAQEYNVKFNAEKTQCT